MLQATGAVIGPGRDALVRENSVSVNPCVGASPPDIQGGTPLPGADERREGKGTTLESAAHPDLVALGRVLRDRLDRTLDAEMEAARSAARRRRSLRDRLLEAEDAGSPVTVSTVDGVAHRGIVEAVGVDHLDLGCPGTVLTVALVHIASIEVHP